MKKKLKVMILALILGSLMATITYYKFLPYLNKKEPTYMYQIGLYKNYQNALSKAQSVKGAIIVNNDYGYQVIAAVAKSANNKEKIEQMLTEDDIQYFAKEVTLPKSANETIDEYEMVIEQTSSPDTLRILNQKLLQALEERLQ